MAHQGNPNNRLNTIEQELVGRSLWNHVQSIFHVILTPPMSFILKAVKADTIPLYMIYGTHMGIEPEFWVNGYLAYLNLNWTKGLHLEFDEVLSRTALN